MKGLGCANGGRRSVGFENRHSHASQISHDFLRFHVLENDSFTRPTGGQLTQSMRFRSQMNLLKLQEFADLQGSFPFLFNIARLGPSARHERDKPISGEVHLGFMTIFK